MRGLRAVWVVVVGCLALVGAPAAAQDAGGSPAPAPLADADDQADPGRDLGRAGLLAVVAALAAGRGGTADLPVVMLVARLGECTALPAGDARDACGVEVVRDLRYAAELTADARTAEVITRVLQGECRVLSQTNAATCRALLGDAGACDTVKDPAERDLCHGYVIEADCETPTSAERTTQACLFRRATAAGSLIACALLEDSDARHLCEAHVTGSRASCGKLSRPDLVARCREALRDGTAPTIDWLAGSEVSPVPVDAPGPGGSAASPSPGSEEDPCANAKPNDPICGLMGE